MIRIMRMTTKAERKRKVRKTETTLQVDSLPGEPPGKAHLPLARIGHKVSFLESK